MASQTRMFDSRAVEKPGPRNTSSSYWYGLGDERPGQAELSNQFASSPASPFPSGLFKLVDGVFLGMAGWAALMACDICRRSASVT